MQHLAWSSLRYQLNAFSRCIKSQGAWLVVVGVLDLPLHFIATVIIYVIIVITSFTINFITFIITRIFEHKQFTALMR